MQITLILKKLLKKLRLWKKTLIKSWNIQKKQKNLEHEKKILLLEALWNIIYSDKNVDMYEANLMRRLSGLLYLDKTYVASIKVFLKIKV